jgi:hypothetical protein
LKLAGLDLGLKVTANAAIFPCMSAKAMGWQIVVTLPGGAAPQIYNVGIADEHQAVDAVRGVLENPKGAVIKVKAELVERVFKALRLQSGQVLFGAQHRKKRPRDANQLGKSIVDIATGETDDRDPTPEEQGKDPAAVNLGRLGGLKGGKARAASMSAKRRAGREG